MKIKLFLLCFALTAGACHSNKDNFSKAAQPTEKTAAPAPQNYSTLDMELQSSAKPMPGMPVTRYVPPAVKKDEDLKRRLKEEEIALDDALTEPVSGESYNPVVENPFQDAHKANISTFSIDVDAASYANVRRFLNEGMLPPADAVRIEEMINYFDYQYNAPRAQHPFDVYTEAAPCPWEPKHRVLLIGLQGKTVDTGQLPASNLVFLMDVSGSMDAPNKLPLVQQSLSLLTDQLRPNDRVAIVVYAGAAGLVLESTPGTEKAKIKAAIGDLHAGGSTAGGCGIRLAYATARKHFIPNGNNRVVLCTDGDFNVGTSSEQELINLIEKERESGTYLTVLGFGDGNYQDGKMQSLADKGNGNHGYIDQLSEAKKLLVREFGGTMFTIAKDVKLQVHFNPQQVAGYRLIGYENRLLATEDFHDDTKDAGEMGAGHRVTALYELALVGSAGVSVDPLRYGGDAKAMSGDAGEIGFLRLRYKAPDADVSRLIEQPIATASLRAKPSERLQFAASVAAFADSLRGGKHLGRWNLDDVAMLAKRGRGQDADGYRGEFVALVEQARALKGGSVASIASE